MRPLRSTSPKNRYINELARELRRARPALGSRGVRIRQRSSGTVYEVRPGAAGGGKAIGMVFRGEYNSGRLYKKSDVVKISAGIASGMYLCLADMTSIVQTPWLGNPWTQLSKLLDQWL